ncbi:MAG: LEA type 2 family protein [Burkholderiaceae bacterium]
MPARRAWLGMALAAVAGGCALPPAGLRAPSLALADLAVAQANAGEIVLAANVDASNPNPVDVVLAEVRFQLDVLGVPLAAGTPLEPRVSLPREGRARVPVRLVVPTRSLVETLREAGRGRDWSAVPYRLRGSARWGDDGVALAFDREGTFDAMRALWRALRR